MCSIFRREIDSGHCPARPYCACLQCLHLALLCTWAVVVVSTSRVSGCESDEGRAILPRHHPPPIHLPQGATRNRLLIFLFRGTHATTTTLKSVYCSCLSQSRVPFQCASSFFFSMHTFSPVWVSSYRTMHFIKRTVVTHRAPPIPAFLYSDSGAATADCERYCVLSLFSVSQRP